MVVLSGWDAELKTQDADRLGLGSGVLGQVVSNGRVPRQSG